MKYLLFLYSFSSFAQQLGEQRTIAISSLDSTVCKFKNTYNKTQSWESGWTDDEIEEVLSPLGEVVRAVYDSEMYCDYTMHTDGEDPLYGMPLYWGQQLIGADLVKEEASLRPIIRKSRIANLDSFFEKKRIKAVFAKDFDWTMIGSSSLATDFYHATSVMNLLSGEGPTSVSANSVISQSIDIYQALEVLKSGELKGVGLADSVEKLSKSNHDFINLEIHALCEIIQCHLEGRNLGDPQEVINSINEMAKRSIVVTAAGNFQEHNVAGKDRSNELNAIVVGNLNPYGVIDYESNEGFNVTIAAPASDSITTIGVDGLNSNFGGTSGSTPLVTGALAEAKAVLGELTLEQSKILLEKTALATANSWMNPRKNGAGMLNSYKLYKVASRLKDKGWPIDADKLLNDASIFDFPEKSQQLYDTAMKKLMSSDCAIRKEGFKKMRKSFLLNPTKENKEALVGIYDEFGHSKSSQFILNLERSNLEVFAKQSLDNPPEHGKPVSQRDIRSIKRAIVDLGI